MRTGTQGQRNDLPAAAKNMRIWCARCGDFRRYKEPLPGRYECMVCTYHCGGFSPVRWIGPRKR